MEKQFWLKIGIGTTIGKFISNTIGIGTAIVKIISNTIGIGIGVQILVLIISGAQFPTPFLDTVFDALSHGVIHFVWSVSFKNLETEVF